MRKLLMLGLVMSLFVFVMTGCTAVQKGMAGGGLIGGAIGGVVAPHGKVIEGIAIGAASGGLLGGLIADQIDENREAVVIAKLNEEIARLQAELAAKNELIAKLQKEIDSLNRRLVWQIELSNDVLFAPGKNTMTKQGKDILDKVLSYVKSAYPGKTIVVEGYADSDPIRYSRWKSNWELGAGRALTILHYAVRCGVDPNTISAQTFGEFHPKASNLTKEGKAQNRRSVITILNKSIERKVENVQ